MQELNHDLFTVSKTLPIQGYGTFSSGSTTTVVHPKKCMTYNADTGEALGVVGTDYQIMQPSECADLVEAVTGSAPTTMWDGSKMVMQAQMNSMLLPGDDQVNTQFTIINSFDGSSALTSMGLSFRMTCSNQLRMAFSMSKGNGFNVSIRHKGDWDSTLESFREACERIAKGQADFSNAVGTLVQKNVSSDDLDKLWKTCAPHVLGLKAVDLQEKNMERTTVKINEYISAVTMNYELERSEGCPDSMWLGANAVTKYIQHSYSAKGKKTDPSVRRVDNAVGRRSHLSASVFSEALSLV